MAGELDSYFTNTEDFEEAEPKRAEAQPAPVIVYVGGQPQTGAFQGSQYPEMTGGVYPVTPQTTQEREKAIFRGNIAAGVGAASKLYQPTGTTEVFSLDNLIQAAAATGMGAVLGGGLPGAAAALVTSGLNAYLTSRAEKRKQNQLKELQQAAEKSRQEQMAREQKWREEDRRDALRSEQYNRNLNALQSKWAAYNTINQTFLNLINNNAELKRRFIGEGF